MQQLLEVKQEKQKSPLELELEAQLDGRRVGPVKVVEQQEEGRTRLLVRLSVLAGLRKNRIAQSVGDQAWQLVQGTKAEPSEIVVMVGDDDNGPVTTLSVPRPVRRR